VGSDDVAIVEQAKALRRFLASSESGDQVSPMGDPRAA
jgi:hypothetical protein